MTTAKDVIRDAAETYLEDLKSGVEDGTYDRDARNLTRIAAIEAALASPGFMSLDEARTLKDGDILRVLVGGCGDVDDEEKHYEPGAFVAVCGLDTFSAPQGWAVTVRVINGPGRHVVNVLDEGDFEGRYPFARPTTAELLLAQLIDEFLAFDEKMGDEDQEGGPRAPTGDDYNEAWGFIERANRLLTKAAAPGEDPWHVGELPGDDGRTVRDENGLTVSVETTALAAAEKVAAHNLRL